MTDLFAKVNCTYCQEEINTVRVKCCVCVDFDICLQCFSVGAEIGPHRNDHAYKFVDHCAASIFGGKGAWTGKEYLQLLDAVELYGFGNWELISEHVETRSPEEVKEEYIARYLDGNIGKATLASVTANKPALIDHVTEDDGPLSPSVTAKLPPLDVTLEEARLLGYKPHRDDYEREYNMEAEQLVCKLVLDPEQDTEMEIVLKLAIIDMYVRRLRERARRKRIVRDYQLVAKYFANMRKDPTKMPQLTKEQRELRDRFRVFSQFLSSGEHERLIASLEREKELRHRLSELIKYRSLGLTTQDEIIHYEQHAAHERQQQLRQSNNKSGSSGYVTREYHHQNGKSGDQDTGSIEKKFTWAQNDACDTNSYSFNNNSNSVSSSDVSTLQHCPMGNLLSENEIHLCASLNIRPIHYTTMKSLLIQDNLQSPGKYRNVSTDADSLEISTKDVITRYLTYSGWLPNVSF
ncbi:transcriptional adapter 2B [Diorhabda sublineata]|uniref:transcriptional adapter 2B n=1 Tax=Diorhabda sublineata TaxID=1163346 RepID=UPI0024E0FFD4|nr:transcriptional adapter 2B [Diorhabda sublineata]